MEMAAYFLVSFVIFQQKCGQDVANTIVGIDRVLSDYYANVHVLHKFKVTGVAKVLAIVEASNFTALDSIITKILDLGTVAMDTQPIRTYESFARSLGVSEELTQPVNVVLRRDKLYLVTGNIGYYGKTTGEYLAIRKRHAENVLSRRLNGELNAVIYEKLAERGDHFFSNIENPVDVDLLLFQIPLTEDNGANVKFHTEALEFLDDYASRTCQFNDY